MNAFEEKPHPIVYKFVPKAPGFSGPFDHVIEYIEVMSYRIGDAWRILEQGLGYYTIDEEVAAFLGVKSSSGLSASELKSMKVSKLFTLMSSKEHSEHVAGEIFSPHFAMAMPRAKMDPEVSLAPSGGPVEAPKLDPAEPECFIIGSSGGTFFRKIGDREEADEEMERITRVQAGGGTLTLYSCQDVRVVKTRSFAG